MSLLAGKQDDEVMSEINITPFTDVLLVLLIIFMILAALVTPPGFQKDLANNNNAPQTQTNDKKKSIDIEVNNKGVIFVDNAKTDEKGIYAVLLDTVRTRGKLHVSITADAKSPYGVIIKILDAAKIARLDDVGFVTS